MADANLSLPVRTENAGDVIVKLGDGTTPSQQLAIDATGRPTVKNQDGAGNALTSQASGAQRALDVGINVAGTQVDPRAVRALTSADVVTAAQGAPNTTANAWPVKTTDGTNTQAVKAASTAAVAGDPAAVVALSPNTPLPTGTNVLGKAGIQVAGADVSALNPVPVSLSLASPGTAIQAYNTAAAVAANATSNHDYTVTAAKTLSLSRLFASASGKMKIEIQIETAAASGTFNTILAAFNSVSTPNIDIDLDANRQVAAGVRVRIIRTNLDKAAMDLYSTVEGSEV